MNRLTNNRVFIGVLLMVLQLAFLPNVSRCSGRHTKLFGESCCCTSSAHAPSEGTRRDDTSESTHSCCSKHAAKDPSEKVEDELIANTGSAGGHAKTCSCPHASSPAVYCVQGGERDDLLGKHAGALLPTAARCNQSCHAIEVRVRCKPIPRAQTGPPLQLIYQVFLI